MTLITGKRFVTRTYTLLIVLLIHPLERNTTYRVINLEILVAIDLFFIQGSVIKKQFPKKEKRSLLTEQSFRERELQKDAFEDYTKKD